MSELIPLAEAEMIVGTYRRESEHYGRAIGLSEKVFVLHSKECLNSGIDLRECEYSKALDQGISMDVWWNNLDLPRLLSIQEGRLVPVREAK